LAYQPPASSIFLSEQISHQQPASSTFLSEQISISHQPPAKRTGCISNTESNNNRQKHNAFPSFALHTVNASLLQNLSSPTTEAKYCRGEEGRGAGGHPLEQAMADLPGMSV
jgi:hypothetical protein